MRIGHGYDVHRLVKGRKLIIGGVDIPHDLGLLGHSDADVLLHAICDAIFGALAEGDLGKHFPDSDPAVTFDNMAKALEAFQATLITPASRFDQFLEGNYDALNAKEKRGLKAFMDVGCSACHAGVNLGGQNYYPFGVVKKPGSEVLPRDDKGRFQVTKTASDNYVFRAAPLRNIELTAPYFHSGQVWDLEQAVAIMGVAQLGQELSQEQVTQITAFLRTLTGEQPRVQYPVLPKGTDATPRPVPFDEAPERR